MIAVTKSFKRQLKLARVSMADIIVAIDRMLNKNILRKGGALLANSFVNLKNCSVVKMRVGQKQQARMLVVFIIIENIKIPFFITNKNDKKIGNNLSLPAMKKIITPRALKILDEFYKDEFDKIDE